MRDRGEVWAVGLAALLAVGACSSEMAPGSAGMMSGTTSTPTTDSLSELASVAGPKSTMIVGTNGGALVGTPAGGVHFYAADPGTVTAAAAAAHVSVCSVELDALVMPPAASADVAASVTAVSAQCAQQDPGNSLAELRQLQTPTTVVIVGANAAETWHSTNNGVNYFYGQDILGMLHAARTLNVTACVVAPSDISVPMYPLGETPGVSIADALAGCELPP